MRIQCIVFHCVIHKVITAASYISDLFKALVIFKYTHQTGNSSLNRHFIYNSCFFCSGLRASLYNIIKHNCKRSLVTDFFRNGKPGQRTNRSGLFHHFLYHRSFFFYNFLRRFFRFLWCAGCKHQHTQDGKNPQ